MPELPEVETVKRGLHSRIIGKSIIAVDFDWSKSFPNASSDVEAFLIGAAITNVSRRAKVLIIDLSTEYSLLVHLKMTGQLVFIPAESTTDQQQDRFGAGHPTDSLIHSLPDKSTRVELTFKDGSKLYFNDQRKFGWMRLMPTIEVPNIDFMMRLGPEPLAANFSSLDFIDRIRRRQNSIIKAVLLDQTVIAGVGNIYADEALFAAGIHPATKVSHIPDGELVLLYDRLQEILRLSIEKGGSSDRNYVNAEGKKGSYISFAKVFRREGKECLECDGVIEKTRVAGRGTHFCPSCQPEDSSSIG